MQDAQARGNLRHALSRIRKALPRTARSGMVVDGPSVALDPAVVDVDVAQFERLVADGRPEALEQIAGLYRGDLLAGLALAERPFEEWLTSERERLHELAIQGLGHLLVHQQKAGAAEPAVQTGLRLLALDPLQEPVHRAVMRLYARLGRREAALRQYQHCADALKRELSTQPEAETTQLYQEILRSRPSRPDRAPVSGPAGGDPAPGPVADLLSASAAALREAPPPTNLPAPTSELIGRAAALAEVTELLRAHRLVTLIGAGGIGKTRLGLDVARELRPGFADGVWVAELAPLSDPGLVPVTVAVALGLTLPAGAGSPERVAAALGTKRLLLVLDNCEHVIETAARLAEALLRANPHAHVMATSREPLRAPGEYVYRVLPLEVPAEGIEDHEDLLEAAAVKLFVTRAQAVELRFSLDARTAAIAGAVCRRLDGIPLAIELAAARTAALGLEELAARLDDRFRLLSGGHRTALPRHQTLQATLDWSYELLSAIERTVLRRLAIFVGGFTLEAASAVATAAGLGAPEVVDSVTNLAAKSLVAVEPTGAVIPIPAARDDAGLRAREARRERRARAGRSTPRRILPRPLRAGRGRMGDARDCRVGRGVRPPDRQRAGGAGLGVFAERRRVDRGGTHCRIGAPVVPVLTDGRVSRPRRARARQSRAPLESRRAPRDAALRCPWRVAHADEGPRARYHGSVDDRDRDRRARGRHRVSASGALGPVAFPRQPRRVSGRTGAGGTLLRPGHWQ
jgi:predicted ATPase/DNA-binding SARP family transcriptional activator